MLSNSAPNPKKSRLNELGQALLDKASDIAENVAERKKHVKQTVRRYNNHYNQVVKPKADFVVLGPLGAALNSEIFSDRIAQFMMGYPEVANDFKYVYHFVRLGLIVVTGAAGVYFLTCKDDNRTWEIRYKKGLDAARTFSFLLMLILQVYNKFAPTDEKGDTYLDDKLFWPLVVTSCLAAGAFKVYRFNDANKDGLRTICSIGKSRAALLVLDMLSRGVIYGSIAAPLLNWVSEKIGSGALDTQTMYINAAISAGSVSAIQTLFDNAEPGNYAIKEIIGLLFSLPDFVEKLLFSDLWHDNQLVMLQGAEVLAWLVFFQLTVMLACSASYENLADAHLEFDPNDYDMGGVANLFPESDEDEKAFDEERADGQPLSSYNAAAADEKSSVVLHDQTKPPAPDYDASNAAASVPKSFGHYNSQRATFKPAPTSEVAIEIPTTPQRKKQNPST